MRPILRFSSIPRRATLPRGTTLLELMVASGILLLLVGTIIGIYQSSARVWRKVDARTAVLRELQVATRYLERGLEVSHPFGLTRAPTKKALAYLSATKADDKLMVNGKGEPLWQKFVVVYVDSNGRLRRREIPLAAPPAKPPTFKQATGDQLETYISSFTPWETDRFLTHAGKITVFELVNSEGFGSLYDLSIVAEQMKTSTETEQLEIHTKISLRN